MVILTKNGFGFFEATSAFQKAIRRNDEPVALYFAVEFFNSGYEEYLWKRIKIIASEDIGLAEPMLPAAIHALHEAFAVQKKDYKDKRPERMFIIHAVLLLLRAPKSRLVDYCVIDAWRSHDDEKMKMPDYAYDMHNYKGKQMGRGVEHFFKEGTLLKNHKVLAGEEEAKKRAFAAIKKHPGALSFKGMKKGTLNQQEMEFSKEGDEE